MTDMCLVYVEEHAKRRSNEKSSGFHCGYCGAQVQQLG